MGVNPSLSYFVGNPRSQQITSKCAVFTTFGTSARHCREYASVGRGTDVQAPVVEVEVVVDRPRAGDGPDPQGAAIEVPSEEA